MGKSGKERRIHKVFVTRNTEYHLRNHTCVGVRDRRTGDWVDGHLAVRSQLSGTLRFQPQGGIATNLGAPQVGESLFFYAEGRDLVTTPVISIERPAKEIVSQYAS